MQLKRHVVTIDSYTDVPPSNEKILLQAVATQPVSVGICGSERAFQLYSKVRVVPYFSLSHFLSISVSITRGFLNFLISDTGNI